MHTQLDSLAFLDGGGELSRLIAAFDWSRTALGPITRWPEHLRVATSMILRSPLAMVMLWGEDGVMLYNDAYGRFAGQRHPAILGGRVIEAWPEAADFNRHVLDVCLGGGALSFQDRRLTLLRSGAAEEVWMDLAYSPVLDAAGRPAGVLAVVVDTTARNLADERLRIAQEAGQFGAFEWYPDRHRLVVSDTYRRIYGLPPDKEISDGELVELVLPEDRDRTGPRQFERLSNPLVYAEYRIRHPVSGEIRWIARRGETLEGRDNVARRFVGVAWDITERKQAEMRDAFLVSLRDRLRDLGDASEVIAVATEMLGRYLDVGRVGYGEIDAAGTHVTVERDWTDGTMPSFAGRHLLEAFGAPIIRAFQAGQTVRVDDTQDDSRLSDPGVAEAFVRIGMRAGIAVPLMREGRFVSSLYVHCAGPRRWEERDEAVIHEVAARIRDAAERARAEQRLRDSEETFRLFAQAMPNQVWAADPDGGLYWCNEQVYSYSGATSDELFGVGWIGIVHQDDHAPAIAAWSASLRDGTKYETEFRLRRRDGVYRWHIARALPIRGAHGQVSRWVGTNTDIEEHRRALADLARLNTTLEERVRERTRERDRTWALSRDPLLVADQDGVWLSVSPAWTTLLGWSEAELVGRTAAWMGHPDDPPLALGTVDADSPAVRVETRLRARDGGYLWFSWTAVPEGRLLYCVARDVTAEREAAERLRQTEEALRQAQKMEAIGQLTGGIAHDFNNLLTGIMGSLDLVRRRIATGRTGDLDRFMEAANASAQRAAALTHRLLAFARRQSLDTQPVRIQALVEGMEELLGRTLGEQVSLHVALAADTWDAMTDPNQLESAILNLAINARDAMPRGGQLTIEAANITLDRRHARVDQGVEPGDYVALSVTDTGTGMTRAVIEKAFDPFFTTKPVGQGTGLGLSMVYGFTRQSGGYVRIYSEPGRGTTVKLFLPRAGSPAEAGEPSPGRAPSGAGETVLVVEDDPAVRMLIVEVLRELGYRTLEAGDAGEALPVLDSSCPIDLLVSDVGLPGLNGRQIADHARQRRPGLKVLFVTGYAENAAIRSGFLAAGMSMITKPFAIEVLASKISEMMAAP